MAPVLIMLPVTSKSTAHSLCVAELFIWHYRFLLCNCLELDNTRSDFASWTLQLGSCVDFVGQPSPQYACYSILKTLAFLSRKPNEVTLNHASMQTAVEKVSTWRSRHAPCSIAAQSAQNPASFTRKRDR